MPSSCRATLLDQAGALAFAQGHYARARHYFEASVELRRHGGGSLRDLAVALNHCAAALRWGCNDSMASVPLYEESLGLARQVDDRLLIGAALMPLGTLALDRGELAQAQQLLQEGLKRYIEADVETAFPLALEQFAALAAARNQAVRALRLAGAGAAWRRILRTHPTPYRAWVQRSIAAEGLMLPHTQADQAWQAGEAMSLEEAIAYAVNNESGS